MAGPDIAPHCLIAVTAAFAQDSQLCALSILSSLSDASDAIAEELLTPELLQLLHSLATTGSPPVQKAAMEAAGNLAFCRANKIKFLKASGFMKVRLQGSGA